MARQKVVDYRWGKGVGHWLSHDKEVQELLEGFLRHVAAKTTSDRLMGFKAALAIKVDGQCCYLLLRPRGFVLPATPDEKEPRRHRSARALISRGTPVDCGLERPEALAVKEVVT